MAAFQHMDVPNIKFRFDPWYVQIPSLVGGYKDTIDRYEIVRSGRSSFLRQNVYRRYILILLCDCF